MSVLTDLADAVVTELNGASFSQSITVARKWLPKYELKEIESAKVAVRPSTRAIEPVSRNADWQEAAVEIGVLKRPSDPAQLESEADAFDLLVEEIIEHLSHRRLSNPSAVPVRIENDPVVDDEFFDQHREFFGLVTIAYRVRRVVKT